MVTGVSAGTDCSSGFGVGAHNAVGARRRAASTVEVDERRRGETMLIVVFEDIVCLLSAHVGSSQ